MCILAIDPGTLKTGYAVLSREGALIDYGTISPPASYLLTERYGIIFKGLKALITKFLPSCVVVETQYMCKNFQSALKVGMARGVVIAAAKDESLPVYEYAPSQAKLASTGRGSASKEQVKNFIQVRFQLDETPGPDEADAIALALCHHQASLYGRLLKKEI